MDPVEQLRTTREKLSPELRTQILALGREAVPGLLAILDDEELGASDSAAEGWPPIHAVSLLAELRAPEAIRPMLEMLASASWEEILHSRLVVRLPDFGAAVVEPALEILANAEEPSAQHSLCCVLSKVGVHDDRIFDALCDLFDDDEALGAMCFADYGDDEALPILDGAIGDFALDPDDAESMHRLRDLESAYEALGGRLPEVLHQRIEAIRREWAARVAARFPGKKTGRNDPCPCGSGKKFKKCCLGKAPADAGIVASPGISREKLAIAESYFREKRTGPGAAVPGLRPAAPRLHGRQQARNAASPHARAAPLERRGHPQPRAPRGDARRAAGRPPRSRARRARTGRTGDAPAPPRDVSRGPHGTRGRYVAPAAASRLESRRRFSSRDAWRV